MDMYKFTLLNNNTADLCQACFAERDDDRNDKMNQSQDINQNMQNVVSKWSPSKVQKAISISTSNNNKEKPENNTSSGNNWQCKHCTYRNHIDLSYCEACDNKHDDETTQQLQDLYVCHDDQKEQNLSIQQQQPAPPAQNPSSSSNFLNTLEDVTLHNNSSITRWIK